MSMPSRSSPAPQPQAQGTSDGIRTGNGRGRPNTTKTGSLLTARKARSVSKISLIGSLPSRQATSAIVRSPLSTAAIRNKILQDGLGSNVLATNHGNESTCLQAMPLLKQRFGRMFDEKYFTDVLFFVGDTEQRLESHRIILCSASLIFQKLLYEAVPLMIDNKYVLHEPDCNLTTFEVFVKSLYTGEVPICLSLAFALNVFYMAKKYDVKFLQKLLIEHVSQAVTTVNVFEALSVSTQMIELTPLITICWKIIEEQTRGVLDQNLDRMDARTLTKVLERDQLNMEEVDLFLYLVKWATIRCKRAGIKVTGKSKRQMLEPLLKYIRFPTMDIAVIHDKVVPTRIMEPKEITAIWSHIHGTENKLPVPYKTEPRRKPLLKPKTIYSGCLGTSKTNLAIDNYLSSSSATPAYTSDSDAEACCSQPLPCITKKESLTSVKIIKPKSSRSRSRTFKKIPGKKRSTSKNQH